ncbi:hypothetical protein E2P81_ATG09391 [Venturia nashicola]|nr:hypothetical protein E2P81_ATG09391 [Venturia nashicola]
MKKGFGTRRVVRKIGQEDDEESSNSPGTSGAEEQKPTRPVISKLKKKSKLRLSFGPGELNPDATSDDDAESAVFTPKKSNLSRIASAKNAERKTLRPALSSEDLAFRAGNAVDRPSYSKDYLAQLKQSTPSTPKSHLSEDERSKKDLDIASKFGPLTTLGANKSAIPSATEIKEKKERRARLAKEQEYISMHPSDSEEERLDLIMQPKEKYPETRLVREDEDVLEGFDDFVEDGRIALGRKAEREEKRKKREEMEAMILQAEGAGSDGSNASEDESEVERNEAYEAAQTRAGTYGSKREDGDGITRPKTPPRVTAVPELGAVLLKLRQGLAEMEKAKLAKIRKLEELRLERKGINEQEVWIQGQLKETGERYEKLRIEAEAAGAPANGEDQGPERGLDSLGTTPMATTPAVTTPAAHPGEASDEEEENPGFVGFTTELRRTPTIITSFHYRVADDTHRPADNWRNEVRTNRQHLSCFHFKDNTMMNLGPGLCIRYKGSNTAPSQPAPLPIAEPPTLPSLESLVICNIDDAVLATLPLNEADRIRDRRTTFRNNALSKPGRFPAEIHILNDRKQATKEAKRETEKGYDERVLVIWTAGDYQEPSQYHPGESAGGGLVTLLPNNDYDAYAISPQMDKTEGLEDTAIDSLTRGLKLLLRKASECFLNGGYTHEIIAYLGSETFLSRLKDIRLRPASSRDNICELYRVAGLIGQAGIELKIRWCSAGSRTRPSMIANELAADQQRVARVRARANMSGQEYRALKFLPEISPRRLEYRGLGMKRSWNEMSGG